MRSFTSALIAAALATFSSAAPLASLDNLPIEAPSVPEKLSFSARGSRPIPQMYSTEEHTESLVKAVHLRNADSQITDTLESVDSKIPQLKTRTSTQTSIDVVFTDLWPRIQTDVDKLNSLSSSDLTIDAVTDSVTALKASLENAATKLRGLSGASADVILSSDSGNLLSVDQIAAVVSTDVMPVLSAAGHVLSLSADSDAAPEIKTALCELGSGVANVVRLSTSLLPGLETALAPFLSSVEGAVFALGLNLGFVV